MLFFLVENFFWTRDLIFFFESKSFWKFWLSISQYFVFIFLVSSNMSAAVLLVVSYTFALIQIAEGNPEELESFLLSLRSR